MKKKKKWIKLVIILLVIAIAAGAIFVWKSHKAKAAAAAATAENTATVEKRSISSQLSSSGTLEEGDQVEKDQVLYEIDRSSMDTDLNSAQNSVTRSQTSYADALDDYNQVASDYSGNTYKATDTGYIKELYISVGDKVSGNTKLADIYSDDLMEIRIPFLSGETELIPVGSTAVLTLVDSGEQIEGTVKAVANREETLSGGRLVKYVTITVNNPGGLTTSTVASAQIGEFVGSDRYYYERRSGCKRRSRRTAGP